MNAHQLAQNAYSGPAAPLRSARGAEHAALGRATFQLKQAAEAEPANFPVLAKALHENRQLWTVFAAEVADDANELPLELRAQIFYLSEFTRVHTSRVLNDNGSVEPLIEVNTAIMRGLRGGEARG